MSKVTKLPSKATPNVMVLGPENETAPLVDLIVAAGLIDAAASEALFNDEQDWARDRWPDH